MENRGKIFIKSPASGSRDRSFHEWDESVLGRPEQIFIWSGSCIYGIQVVYSSNQRVTLGEKHGGTGSSNFRVVNLGGKSLKCIRGSAGSCPVGDGIAVTSLSFQTTCGSTYGPFGNPSGHPFSIDLAGSRAGGFHGRSCGRCLRAIGVYVETNAREYVRRDNKLALTA